VSLAKATLVTTGAVEDWGRMPGRELFEHTGAKGVKPQY
jgi:hypothetical protein